MESTVGSFRPAPSRQVRRRQRCSDSFPEIRSRLSCRDGKATTCGRSGRAWFREPRTGVGVCPLAAYARTRFAPALPLGDGLPNPLGRAAQQATDRRGTARSSYQSQPRHPVGRRDRGSAHRAATPPPLEPATTGKTEQRILRPFPSRSRAWTSLTLAPVPVRAGNHLVHERSLVLTT